MALQRVYLFREGNAEMKDLLGGKGANLAEICSLGIAVPPGLTITTEVCQAYYQGNKKCPKTEAIADYHLGKEMSAFPRPVPYIHFGIRYNLRIGKAKIGLPPEEV